MKLENKKRFAANVLGVGKGRILFNNSRLSEIKEAMTRQDIKDLFSDGAIAIKEIKGRRKIEKRRNRRRAGSIRVPVKKTKQRYMIITRKLRGYLSELRKAEKIDDKTFLMLRKEIRASNFKDKGRLKERIRLLEVKK
ncbi:MAG TPA: 50S ribosomal protein L19e [Candidatus Nanoarchaeia archaeon]|nr:50S ribosomal protein L19e [Candidatus Nanoarchaeia archaeon]